LTSFDKRLQELHKGGKFYAGSLPKTNFNCFLIRFQIVTEKYSSSVTKFISIYLNKYEFEIIISLFGSLDDSTKAAKRVLWPVAVCGKASN
jgi:hypothetical protein